MSRKNPRRDKRKRRVRTKRLSKLIQMTQCGKHSQTQKLFLRLNFKTKFTLIFQAEFGISETQIYVMKPHFKMSSKLSQT